MSDIEDAHERLIERAGAWRVLIDEVFETSSSLIAYGRRATESVVLKLVKRRGDEWQSGQVVRAFAGHGMVRTYEHVGGATLMERLSPGNSLVELAVTDRDDEATAIIAGVMHAMSAAQTDRSVARPTVEAWGEAFARHASMGDQTIASDLVSEAHRTFDELCQSQSTVRLLHGDLQHSNIVFDERRGWVAIDPKGVVGEAEYEVGAALRNPIEAPTLFTSAETIERRIRQLSNTLELDAGRALRWTFAQAVLSALWMIEDGEQVDASWPALVLAETVRRMLSR